MKLSAPNRRRGQVSLVIAILVVMIGALVIGYLFHLIKQKLGPMPTNSVSMYIEGTMQVPTGTTITDFPRTTESSSMLIRPPVYLTYWFSSYDGQTHVMLGTPTNNWEASTYTGIIVTNESDTNCIDVTFENMGSPSRSIVSTGADSTYDRCFPIQPIIERSTNGIDWERLYTNTLPYADTNYTLIDRDAPWPSAQYRISYDTNWGFVTP